jgi:hypothetical protein
MPVDIRAGAIGAAFVAAVLLGAQAQAPSVNRPRTAAQAISAAPMAQRTMNFTAVNRALFQTARARPAAQALRASLARTPRMDFAAIDRSHVPVLLTARRELMPNWRVYASADRYTASSRKPGTVYEINGTRLPTVAPSRAAAPAKRMRLRAFAAPGAPPPGPADDALENVHIDHTASGVDVTFTRFGHVYNVSIDCGAPAEAESETAPVGGRRARPLARTANADCTDAGALAFAQQMEVVGGGVQ